MRLSGYQPQYFPRLHFFNRVLNSDIFEFSDYIQFVQKHAYPQSDGTMKRSKSYQAHSPVKLSSGVFFLTIPTPDVLVSINNIPLPPKDHWRKKHLQTIESAYGKAPNFHQYFPELTELIRDTYPSLSHLNIKSFLWGVLRLLTDDTFAIKDITVGNINTLLSQQQTFRLKKIFIASETQIPAPGKGQANEWIINLCRYAGADEYYYGGTSHASYMNLETFRHAGITTTLQDWTCPEYSQQFKHIGFLPNLSIIDLIFNESLPKRQEILL